MEGFEPCNSSGFLQNLTVYWHRHDVFSLLTHFSSNEEFTPEFRSKTCSGQMFENCSPAGFSSWQMGLTQRLVHICVSYIAKSWWHLIIDTDNYSINMLWPTNLNLNCDFNHLLLLSCLESLLFLFLAAAINRVLISRNQGWHLHHCNKLC